MKFTCNINIRKSASKLRKYFKETLIILIDFSDDNKIGLKKNDWNDRMFASEVSIEKFLRFQASLANP